MAPLVISEVSDDGMSVTRIVPLANIDTVEVSMASHIVTITTKTGSVVEANISDEIKFACDGWEARTSADDLVAGLVKILS